jgi:hypothetical protein
MLYTGHGLDKDVDGSVLDVSPLALVVLSATASEVNAGALARTCKVLAAATLPGTTRRDRTTPLVAAQLDPRARHQRAAHVNVNVNVNSQTLPGIQKVY